MTIEFRLKQERNNPTFSHSLDGGVNLRFQCRDFEGLPCSDAAGRGADLDAGPDVDLGEAPRMLAC
jgi:hypothetical protein